jgi:hypothetical protein
MSPRHWIAMKAWYVLYPTLPFLLTLWLSARDGPADDVAKVAEGEPRRDVSAALVRLGVACASVSECSAPMPTSPGRPRPALALAPTHQSRWPPRPTRRTQQRYRTSRCQSRRTTRRRSGYCGTARRVERVSDRSERERPAETDNVGQPWAGEACYLAGCQRAAQASLLAPRRHAPS